MAEGKPEEDAREKPLVLPTKLNYWFLLFIIDYIIAILIMIINLKESNVIVMENIQVVLRMRNNPLDFNRLSVVRVG